MAAEVWAETTKWPPCPGPPSGAAPAQPAANGCSTPRLAGAAARGAFVVQPALRGGEGWEESAVEMGRAGQFSRKIKSDLLVFRFVCLFVCF